MGNSKPGFFKCHGKINLTDTDGLDENHKVLGHRAPCQHHQDVSRDQDQHHVDVRVLWKGNFTTKCLGQIQLQCLTKEHVKDHSKLKLNF